MTKGEFESAYEEQHKTGRIVEFIRDDSSIMTDEMVEFCDKCVAAYKKRRELGYIAIATKKRNGNEWNEVYHPARILSFVRGENGYKVEIRLP